MKTMLALALLTACGSDPSSSLQVDASTTKTDADPSCGATCQPYYTSGTRIKMLTLITPDGARQFIGWRDLMYGDECAFVKTSDGATRCMPLDVVPALIFSDSACSLPAAAAYVCNPPPKYIQQWSQVQGCASTTITNRGTIWMRGAQLSSAWQKSGNNCIPYTADSTVVVYGVGTEIPLSNWQPAVVGVDP